MRVDEMIRLDPMRRQYTGYREDWIGVSGLDQIRLDQIRLNGQIRGFIQEMRVDEKIRLDSMR